MSDGKRGIVTRPHGSLPRDRRRELMEKGRARGRVQLAYMRENRVTDVPGLHGTRKALTLMTRDSSYLREEWQDPDLPITGPPPKARRTKGVVHWSGSDSIPADKPAWLRSMQSDYVNNRGYSLGYGYLVTGDGSDYEIRGADFNMASNPGDKVDGNANDWTLSILLDVTTTAAATPAAIETCRRIFADAGIVDRPVPHSFYDYTACCGDIVRAQIDAGVFDISPTTPPIPPTTPPPTGTPGKDFDMYVLNVTRQGWPAEVTLIVAADGVRWPRSDHTWSVDRVAGAGFVTVSKDQLIGMLGDRSGIGPCPFDGTVPGYEDSDLAGAW